ncbi:tetratricopeptide repeat protein [Candidatus Odyssella thessalonicensis]|uniref:tetratricopeptide repeat protein n=1 Tax=Candidatus Odyssella thessalonicensis TaxID=84647 RepID=UPI000225AEBF|nr:tetratricopeptide repeat protein [Candidatus Odyssella thessalonicensis]
MAEKDKFDEFLDEVEQDIRQEKFKQIWDKYGKQASSAITVLLVAVASYSLWSNYQTRELERQSDFYVKAQTYLEQGEPTKALSLLKELSAGNKAYATFAKFSQAAILSEPGKDQDLDKAFSLYQEIANDSRLEQVWRDTAALQLVSLSFEKDPQQAETLLAKIEPLCEPGRPLQALALEQKGLILYLSGKKSEAADIFVQIVQLGNAPENVKWRAQTMAQQISSES